MAHSLIASSIRLFHPLSKRALANIEKKSDRISSSSTDNSSLDRDKKLLASFTFD